MMEQQRNTLVKILYVEKDIDEKGAAKVLEQSTQALQSLTCVFTVVPNAFVALEYTETTCFDIIFIRKDLTHLTAFDFLKILRNVGSPVDIVLLVEPDDPITEEMAQKEGFYTVLRKEYQTIDLCTIISNIIQRRNYFNQYGTLANYYPLQGNSTSHDSSHT